MYLEQGLFYTAMGCIAIMSILGFAVMGIDKHRAIKRKWRIPEKTLLIIACFGGGIGSLLGMLLFQHKTRHAKFVIILPVTAGLYTIAILKMSGVI